MADTTINRRARVGGSGFTVFLWGDSNDPIGFARQIAHTTPTPVGPGPTPIQPLDAPYPIDIVTPAAASIGTLVVEMYEMYNQKVWDSLMSELNGAVDIVDVYVRIAQMEKRLKVVKRITPPIIAGNSAGATPYTEIFHNCVITNIEDGETIEVGTMEVLKRVTVAYTHLTRTGHSRTKQLASRM